MQCHYCGYNVKASHTCPKCTGTQIKYIGVGTQQIEKEIFRLFPDVHVLRMDIDTTIAKGAHGKILQRFKEGKADILLGTQMIAKGLDFEKVSLVGVMSADIGLTFPDFRSAERVFQLLTQVAGRSGRKHKQGEVVIQTRMEKHYAIKFARRHDYNGFYHKESNLRKVSIYPPFCRLIKIGVSSHDKIVSGNKARDIVNTLRNYSQQFFDIIGPAPSPLARLKNKYRWQILLKIDINHDPAGKQTRQFIRYIFKRHKYDQESGISVIIDIDPADMM
jgi:primosomal protein N' (replication factor Y)